MTIEALQARRADAVRRLDELTDRRDQFPLHSYREQIEQLQEEIDAILEADNFNFDRWELGREIRFLFADYREFKRQHGRCPDMIAPCDADETAIERFKKDCKNATRRERRAAMTVIKLSDHRKINLIEDRELALIEALQGRPWQTTGKLMKALADCAAFKHDGVMLEGKSFRQAITAEVRKLERAHRIETITTDGKYRPNVMLVRLCPGSAHGMKLLK